MCQAVLGIGGAGDEQDTRFLSSKNLYCILVWEENKCGDEIESKGEGATSDWVVREESS